MSDSNDVTHPEWRQLYQAALFETNTAILVERIAQARNAVLDRIEDSYSMPPTSETSCAAGRIGHARPFTQDYGATKWLSVKG
jgi:hypothetical protein